MPKSFLFPQLEHWEPYVPPKLKTWDELQAERERERMQARLDEEQRVAAKQQAASALYQQFQESIPGGLYSQSISNLQEPVKNYFMYKYNDVYNEYLAELAKTAQAGQEPSLKFGDFLSKYDYLKNYMRQPYINRGGYQARNLAPPTRFINY